MGSNGAPFEIIAAPFTAWLAAVGTAFPDPADEPGVGWTKLGSSGDLNYAEDGVKVDHSQSLSVFRPLGSTGPRKAFRTEEGLVISLTLVDLSLEQYAVALNHNAVTETNAKKVGLSRGLAVTRKALLVRGPSPYDEDLNMQYEVPIVVVSGSPQPVFRRGGDPAGLALEFMALEDTSASDDSERFGRVVADDGAT